MDTCVDKLMEANRVVAHCEKTGGLSAHPNDRIFVGSADALAGGACAGSVDKRCGEGRPRSLLHYLFAQRGHLTSESCAVVAATAQLEWTMEQYDELADGRYQPDLIGKRVMGPAEKNIHIDSTSVKDNLPDAVS